MSGDTPQLSRRRALGLGLGAVAGAAACGTGPEPVATPSTPPPPPTSAPDTPSAPPTVSTTSPATGGPAVEVVRGNGIRPEVALTFHGAGDVSSTREVLDILARHHARATVLAVGTWLTASPDAAKLVLDGGHDLGNHTWSHPNLSAYAPGPMYDEIARCRDELVRLTGHPGAFFRQSAGQHPTPEQLVQAGKAGYARVLSYDVDSTDWTGATPAAIRRAVATATAGSVISLHLGRRNTVQALPDVLQDLAGRGLSAVTGTDLLR